jgi:hypothetical protein
VPGRSRLQVSVTGRSPRDCLLAGYLLLTVTRALTSKALGADTAWISSFYLRERFSRTRTEIRTGVPVNPNVSRNLRSMNRR